EASEALAGNVAYLPGPAIRALPALIAALPSTDSLSPPTSSSGGAIARAIVAATRADPQARNDTVDAALARTLLLELQPFPTRQADTGLALGALITGNPAIIDRPISLSDDPLRKSRGALTVYEHLRSDVLASNRPGLAPHAHLLALGSIASVR